KRPVAQGARVRGGWRSEPVEGEAGLEEEEVVVGAAALDAVEPFGEGVEVREGEAEADAAGEHVLQSSSSADVGEDLPGRGPVGDADHAEARSEERRVGKECRSRRSECHEVRDETR